MYFWASDLTRGNLIYNGAANDSSGLMAETSSEDCLSLAVWAPSADVPVPEGGFPVIFFMTGGGFAIGGIDIPWQMPTGWVERTQSFIIVTINYRLGIFGFPNARGLAAGDFSQNLGILDQRMALEWVRDNIEAFGGNPERITHWRRSSGALSADIHSYAWHEDPIAQSYWLQSGSALGAGSWEDSTYSNSTFVARQMRCDAPYDTEDEQAAAELELDCMRNVSATQLVNFIGQYTDRHEEPPVVFHLVVDDKVVFSNYDERAEAGQVAKRPAIISTTANEWSTLLPWPYENVEKGPPQGFTDEVNLWLNCKALSATRARTEAGIPVYRIQYAGIFPNLNVYGWLGAYHASHTPASFGTYHLMDHIAPSTDRQAATSRAMQDYFEAFARDPYNGPQHEFGWKPMDSSGTDGGMLLRLGAGGKAAQFVDGVETDGVCDGKGEYDPFP